MAVSGNALGGLLAALGGGISGHLPPAPTPPPLGSSLPGLHFGSPISASGIDTSNLHPGVISIAQIIHGLLSGGYHPGPISAGGITPGQIQVPQGLGHPAEGAYGTLGPAWLQHELGNNAQAAQTWESHHQAAMAGHAPIPEWVRQQMTHSGMHPQ